MATSCAGGDDQDFWHMVTLFNDVPQAEEPVPSRDMITAGSAQRCSDHVHLRLQD
jgi:hypothetical protein